MLFPLLQIDLLVDVASTLELMRLLETVIQSSIRHRLKKKMDKKQASSLDHFKWYIMLFQCLSVLKNAGEAGA